MNKSDYIRSFCLFDVYPKLLLLSTHHSFLGIGSSNTPIDLAKPDCFYVYSRFFYKEQISSFWDPFPKENIYLPDRVYLDGKEYNYSNKVLSQQPYHKAENRLHFTNHNLSFEDWERLLRKAKESGLEKVVLARQSSFKGSVDMLSLLENLSFSRGSLFAYQIDQDHLFFGLTPEHLLIRHNKQVFTEALAGTRKRGSFKGEDYLLEQELLHSPKDLQEFLFVSDYIKQLFQDKAQSIKTSPINVKKNSTVQHLNQTFDITLKEDYPDPDLIDLLHPTPAVCGLPKQQALNWLKENECLDRGLYASPIGWIGKNWSEIVVGIRSSLIKKQELFLFAGVGIVENSDPALEWQELNHKLHWMKNIIYEQNGQIQSLMV